MKTKTKHSYKSAKITWPLWYDVPMLPSMTTPDQLRNNAKRTEANKRPDCDAWQSAFDDVALGPSRQSPSRECRRATQRMRCRVRRRMRRWFFQLTSSALYHHSQLSSEWLIPTTGNRQTFGSVLDWPRVPPLLMLNSWLNLMLYVPDRSSMKRR